MKPTISAVTLLLTSTLAMVSAPCASAEETTFYSSPSFKITESDLKSYLGAVPDEDGSVEWGSLQRVQVALSELYTLKALDAEADSLGLLSEEEKAWIADYQVAMAGVEKLTDQRVAEKMRSLDWEEEARTYYAANKPEFMTRQEITVRTLVLTLDNRTLLEAVTLATEIVDQQPALEEFAALVSDHTDDPNNKDGVIANLKKGMTVREFETAAFALEQIGDISPPVVSMYGVHVIQLLDNPPRRYLTYEEVKEAVIAELKQRRAAQFRALVAQEPHRNRPADVTVHQAEIDLFLQEVADAAAAAAAAARIPLPAQ